MRLTREILDREFTAAHVKALREQCGAETKRPAMNFYRQTGVVVGSTGVNAEVKRMAEMLVERILADHARLGDDWPDGICVEVMVYEHVPVAEVA